MKHIYLYVSIALIVIIAATGLFLYKKFPIFHQSNTNTPLPAALRATENVLDAIDSLGNALKHNIDVLTQTNYPKSDLQDIEQRVFKLYKKFKWEYELISGKKVQE